MRRLILAAIVAILAAGSPLPAAEVNLQELMHELQKEDEGPNSYRLVSWLPTEYWKASFRNAPGWTEEQKKQFYETVDEYIVLYVIDAKKTLFGGVDPSTRDEIVSRLSLSIGGGKPMKPLADGEISADAMSLFAMMKPPMAAMYGKLGESVEFICFKGVDANGKKLLDPTKSGSFSVTLGDSTYRWRLPLGSLLPPKYDPKTGETFPGNYIYSPFTGGKLVSRAPNKET